MSSDNRKSIHVRFDEETIKEHDKLRGTRQKIDEPDTPFHRGSIDEQEECCDGDTEKLLEETAKQVEVVFDDDKLAGAKPKNVQEKQGGIDFSELQSKLNDSDLEPSAAKASAHDDFASKRKHHYNEYEMLRKWREEHTNDDDDDEDED